MQKLFAYTLTALMFLMTTMVQAETPAVLDRSDVDLTASENFLFLATNDETITLNDLQLRISEFRSYQDYATSLDYMDNPTRFLWAKLEINLPARQTERDWEFLLAQAPFSSLRVYITKENGQWNIYDVVPNEAPAPGTYGTNIVFPAEALRSGNNTILIRFENLPDITKFKLARLMTHERIEDLKHSLYLYSGIFMGVIVGLVIFNFILFFVHKSPPYIYYALGNLGLLFFILMTSGLYDGIFTAAYGTKWWRISTLSMGFGAFFLIMFFKYFMNDPTRKKWLYHALSGGAVGLLIIALLMQVVPDTVQPTLSSAFNLLALLTTTMMIAEAIYAIVQGSKAAIYILSAYFLLLLGLTIRVLVSMNILSVSVWADLTLYSGIGLEVLLLALALAYRARKLELELAETEGEKDKMRDLALSDDLTSLRNRRYIDKSGKAFMKKCTKLGESFSVCLVSLSGLAVANDRFGRVIGDKLIKVAAKDMLDTMVNRDYLARYRGSEFIVILPKKGEDAAEIYARRIQNSLHAIELPAELSAIKLGCNVGVASMREGDVDFDQIIRRAEIALFAAKQMPEDSIVASSFIDANLGGGTNNSQEEQTDTPSQNESDDPIKGEPTPDQIDAIAEGDNENASEEPPEKETDTPPR